MRKFLYMLLLFCFPFAPFLSAQPYTLEDCKQMALEHNARLKEKQLDQEVAQLMRKEALSYFLPNVSLAGMGFQAAAPIMEIDMGMLGNMAMYEKGVFAGAVLFQPVFMGGKLLYANKLANTGIQAAGLFTAMMKEEILAETVEYYWLLYSLYEKRNTVHAMSRLLDTLSKDVEQANKAGVLNKNEVLKVRIQKNTLESKSVELENGIFLATMALARQMGIQVNDLEQFEVQYPLDPPITDPMELYVEPTSVIHQRTEYKLLTLGENAAALERKVETSSYLPKAGVSAMYYYENFLAKDKWNGVVMAGVQIPITDWYRGSLAIKQKRIAEQQARLTKEDGQQQLLMQIQQAWGTLLESYQKYMLAEMALDSSQENARLNEDYFHAGTVNLTELLLARGLLQESRDKRIDAIKDYQLAKSTYLQVTGR